MKIESRVYVVCTYINESVKIVSYQIKVFKKFSKKRRSFPIFGEYVYNWDFLLLKEGGET